MIFFEQAREQAEADYKANNNDAQARRMTLFSFFIVLFFSHPGCPILPSSSQALTRWGGALLELAHLRQGPEAVEYIETVRSLAKGKGKKQRISGILQSAIHSLVLAGTGGGQVRGGFALESEEA